MGALGRGHDEWKEMRVQWGERWRDGETGDGETEEKAQCSRKRKEKGEKRKERGAERGGEDFEDFDERGGDDDELRGNSLVPR
jgi:hypothetical protein